MSFKVWRQKQRLLDNLFDTVINELDLPWNNKELGFDERYKIFLKNYRHYAKARIIFHTKLRDEIFKNNNLDLSLEDARSWMSAIWSV